MVDQTTLIALENAYNERNRLNSDISRLNSQAATYKKQISILEQEITDLRAERDKLNEEITKYKNVKSAVSKATKEFGLAKANLSSVQAQIKANYQGAGVKEGTSMAGGYINDIEAIVGKLGKVQAKCENKITVKRERRDKKNEIITRKKESKKKLEKAKKDVDKDISATKSRLSSVNSNITWLQAQIRAQEAQG